MVHNLDYDIRSIDTSEFLFSGSEASTNSVKFSSSINLKNPNNRFEITPLNSVETYSAIKRIGFLDRKFISKIENQEGFSGNLMECFDFGKTSVRYKAFRERDYFTWNLLKNLGKSKKNYFDKTPDQIMLEWNVRHEMHKLKRNGGMKVKADRDV